MAHWSKSLVRIQACIEAREWCAKQPSRQAAWDACELPNWMLYALDKSGVVTDAQWRLLRCAFARAALPYAGELHGVCEAAISVAERFVRGEASHNELKAAWSAAWGAAEKAAAATPRNAAARNAAWSAADAADADDVVSGTARYTARCAAWRAVESAGWNAAPAAGADDTAWGAVEAARSAARKAQCDTIRQAFPRHCLPTGVRRRPT